MAFVNQREVPSFAPVTGAMLADPPPGEWLSWRRTLDGQGHSPLAQITTRSVHQLRAEWVWAMNEGGVQTAPFVHGGTMYLANTGGMLQALDARTGDLLWEYRPSSPRRGGHVKAIALYRDKVFFTTSDAAVVALNARNGTLAWQPTRPIRVASGCGSSGWEPPRWAIRLRTASTADSTQYYV